MTLALKYAGIPYTPIYDDEVEKGDLSKYEWLHLHHEDFTGQLNKFYYTYRDTPWYVEMTNSNLSTARRLGFSNIPALKKDVAELSIPLERNPDILAELGQNKGQRVLVGFAAETQDLMANAAQKVRTKHLDFIVANDISDPSIGFASDDNRVHILDAAGQIEELPTMAKAHLADHILDRVQTVLAQRAGGRA